MRIPLLLTATTSLLLGACSSSSTRDMSKASPQNLYCDNYLSYRMCVQDTSGNGEVDLMYFADTREIFMSSTAIDQASQPGLGVHRCHQDMDRSMQIAASQLLSLSESDSALHSSSLKTKLIMNYARYSAKVSTCYGGNYALEEDNFGDEEDWEL